MRHEHLNLTTDDYSFLIDTRLTHPQDVVRHTGLSFDEKRAALAAWASDAHAVPDAPTMRQLDKGAVVDLSAVLDALKELDAVERRESVRADDRGKRRNDILIKWRRRPPWRRRRRDDDDNDGGPPPVPAAVCLRDLNPAWV